MNRIWVTEMKEGKEWNPTYNVGLTRHDGRASTKVCVNTEALPGYKYRTEQYISVREILELLQEIQEDAKSGLGFDAYEAGMLITAKRIKKLLKVKK